MNGNGEIKISLQTRKRNNLHYLTPSSKWDENMHIKNVVCNIPFLFDICKLDSLALPRRAAKYGLCKRLKLINRIHRIRYITHKIE